MTAEVYPDLAPRPPFRSQGFLRVAGNEQFARRLFCRSNSKSERTTLPQVLRRSDPSIRSTSIPLSLVLSRFTPYVVIHCLRTGYDVMRLRETGDLSLSQIAHNVAVM